MATPELLRAAVQRYRERPVDNRDDPESWGRLEAVLSAADELCARLAITHEVTHNKPQRSAALEGEGLDGRAEAERQAKECELDPDAMEIVLDVGRMHGIEDTIWAGECITLAELLTERFAELRAPAPPGDGEPEGFEAWNDAHSYEDFEFQSDYGSAAYAAGEARGRASRDAEMRATQEANRYRIERETAMREERDEARAEVERLTAERDEARAFGEEAAAKYNELLAKGRVLRCAFCDAEYPPGTPPTQHEALTAHVMECPSHPLRADAEKVRELREAAEALARISWVNEPEGSQVRNDSNRLRRALAALEMPEVGDGDN